MHTLNEQSIYCPYCGESIDVLIDSTDAFEEYIEDCQVCCRPITFKVSLEHEGGAVVDVFNENDG